ncbi:MAG: hypothetical protein WC058_00620 [Phycisphaeraceae bacterium]
MPDAANENPTVYVETTIVSYVTGKPSRDVIVRGNQEVTRQWWETRRARYRLFVSAFVIEEASAGDEQAAGRRLKLLEDLDVLGVEQEAEGLALAASQGAGYSRQGEN